MAPSRAAKVDLDDAQHALQVARTVSGIYLDAEDALFQSLADHLWRSARAAAKAPSRKAKLEDLQGRAARHVSARRRREVLSELRPLAADGPDERMVREYLERRSGEVKALRLEAKSIVARLERRVFPVVGGGITAAWRRGVQSAIDDLKDIGGKQGVAAGQGVVEMARQMVKNLRKRHISALRTIDDVYQEVNRNVIGRVLAGAETVEAAVERELKEYARRGVLTFVDRAGKVWDMPTYAEMAVRTSAIRAATDGHTATLREAGHRFVIVSIDAYTCERCAPFEGEVLAIDDGPTGELEVEHFLTGEPMTIHVRATVEFARRVGFQHPNCGHTLGLYTPGVTTRPQRPVSAATYDDAQRQRSLENRLRTAKRQAALARTPAGQKQARQRVRELGEELDALAEDKGLRRRRDRERVKGLDKADVEAARQSRITVSRARRSVAEASTRAKARRQAAERSRRPPASSGSRPMTGAPQTPAPGGPGEGGGAAGPGSGEPPEDGGSANFRTDLPRGPDGGHDSEGARVPPGEEGSAPEPVLWTRDLHDPADRPQPFTTAEVDARTLVPEADGSLVVVVAGEVVGRVRQSAAQPGRWLGQHVDRTQTGRRMSVSREEAVEQLLDQVDARWRRAHPGAAVADDGIRDEQARRQAENARLERLNQAQRRAGAAADAAAGQVEDAQQALELAQSLNLPDKATDAQRRLARAQAVAGRARSTYEEANEAFRAHRDAVHARRSGGNATPRPGPSGQQAAQDQVRERFAERRAAEEARLQEAHDAARRDYAAQAQRLQEVVAQAAQRRKAEEERLRELVAAEKARLREQMGGFRADMEARKVMLANRGPLTEAEQAEKQARADLAAVKAKREGLAPQLEKDLKQLRGGLARERQAALRELHADKADTPTSADERPAEEKQARRVDERPEEEAAGSAAGKSAAAQEEPVWKPPISPMTGKRLTKAEVTNQLGSWIRTTLLSRYRADPAEATDQEILEVWEDLNREAEPGTYLELITQTAEKFEQLTPMHRPGYYKAVFRAVRGSRRKTQR
ncbi:phage minor capsid protein [Streptosporangium sp. NPDC020072]|uniref:phage minor capsid protein n=1 Tax=Streptosporangium sp. NPDC020072 TaxID=3154788 RepID=UPI003423ECF1